jgi:hypothetical protein
MAISLVRSWLSALPFGLCGALLASVNWSVMACSAAL